MQPFLFTQKADCSDGGGEIGGHAGARLLTPAISEAYDQPPQPQWPPPFG